MEWNKIHELDCITGLEQLDENSIDCVLIDPPYNIGYDFGNNQMKSNIEEYVAWSSRWINESLRVLKPSGTMYIYGFSEILAHLSATLEVPHRWLIWHYKNKTVPSSKFWQRTHESIICANKDASQRYFDRDLVREPYTENYVKGYAGKNRKRPGTGGRFGNTETTYKPHSQGALPRDVLHHPTLAGGSGGSERIYYCNQCEEAFFGSKEKKKHDSHKDQILKHPTQKPLELTKRLLSACVPPGGRVVIPFSGSGSECYVAKSLGIKFLGFDINGDYVKHGLSLLDLLE